jgi:hypothetical protein
MTAQKWWIACGLFAGLVLLLVVLVACVHVVEYFRKSPEYRFPFPAAKPLTEKDAIELSKRAMILDGKRSDVMHPVLSGHKDSEGREVFFCRRGGTSDEGWVLWWLERPDHQWEYSVGVAREGDDVVCRISKPQ